MNQLVTDHQTYKHLEKEDVECLKAEYVSMGKHNQPEYLYIKDYVISSKSQVVDSTKKIEKLTIRVNKIVEKYGLSHLRTLKAYLQIGQACLSAKDYERGYKYAKDAERIIESE